MGFTFSTKNETSAENKMPFSAFNGNENANFLSLSATNKIENKIGSKQFKQQHAVIKLSF